MILGVTGTNGAGKGAVVEYLVTQKGFAHYSARDFIVEEIMRRGLPVSRDTTREVANDLRKTHYPAYIIESLYVRAVEKGGDAVIESIREVAGAEFLHKKGAKILAVDADRNTRYARCGARGSALDTISFTTFCEQEDREMNSPDAWDMNIFGVMERADAVLMNDSTLEKLHADIDTFLDSVEWRA